MLSIFLKCKILPIDQQVKIQNCLFAFEQIKNQTPVYFNDFLQPLGENHDHGTRGRRLAHFESNTVTYGINNLRNSITRDWNNTVNELAINPLQVSKNTYKNTSKPFS